MKKFSILVVIILFAFTSSDINSYYRVIEWEFNKSFDFEGNKQKLSLYFDGCAYSHSTLPYYYEKIDLEADFGKVVLGKTTFSALDDSILVVDEDLIPDSLEIEQSVLKSRNESYLNLKINPFKKVNGKIYLLKSFTYKVVSEKSELIPKSVKIRKNESVLNSGFWIKIKTSKKGIYRIPYSSLQEWGFSSPGNVSVFGNGGYMLPEAVSNNTETGLKQISVWTGKDNSGNDCLFFYAPGNIQWVPDAASGGFKQTLNVYSNSSYYYLSEDQGELKTVTSLQAVNEPEAVTIENFNDFNVHEQELDNLIKSGKQWFGERFIRGQSKVIPITCPGRVSGSVINIDINAAGRSSDSTKFKIAINGSDDVDLDFNKVNIDNTTTLYAYEKNINIVTNSGGEDLEVRLYYSAFSTSAEAWLDYIRVNYIRNLEFSSEPLFFRNSEEIQPETIGKFVVKNGQSGLKIFDITEISEIYDVPFSINGSQVEFKRPVEELREYVVFNPESDFTVPDLVGEVPNQNLHALSVPEMIVISHPNFLETANELADFHRVYDDMSVEVVKSTEVYNEFGSGIADVSAIRNFIKLLYSKDRNKLKYVLLFGDGSYDNRNLKGYNKNFLPTFQSDKSLLPTGSFVTDDFYVLLDEGETVYGGAIDLGIGRIPSSTIYEAQLVLDKVKNYNGPEALGDWRNMVCFIADDENSNTHMVNTEKLANKVNSEYGAFITSKIYFDAFQQEATPGGERYPEVTEAINKRVKEGVLILNYIGHANDRYLSEENVLDVSHINSWSNINNLPIFVTATCEFSRFDADGTSAGEYVLFNPSGGGIGLFSTTRVVYSHANFRLSNSFYDHVFEQDENGNHHRMGDIIRLAKTSISNDTNKRSFSLFADPALRLSYPKYKVITTSINQKDAGSMTDTIKALDMITIEGYISDYNDNKLNDFNGEITPVVYDKAFMLSTLGNGGQRPMEFKVQNNIIYKGRASVNNGNFTFSFIVPKDISYNLGQGKIVYYAQNSEEDAHGAFENFLIGGSAEGQIVDNNGPEVNLYLDDESFTSGDETSRNPLLLAYISDENGINTVGTGIGHDATAVLDGDMSNVLILNDYYKADIDDYTSGKIEFPLSDISEGKHTLKLKVWDVANNSTEVEIEFVVTGNFFIKELVNYPNPVTEYTFFSFEHNQPNASFDGLVEIFDMNGRIIDSFKTVITSGGMKSNPIRWDVLDAEIPILGGIYFYRISIKSSDGSVAWKTGKMNILR